MSLSSRPATITANDICPEIHDLIQARQRQLHSTISLVASQNFPTPAVHEVFSSFALGSQNYESCQPSTEGFQGNGFYNGTEAFSRAEAKAIERATQLFGCKHANLQPHGGSEAVQAAIQGLVPEEGGRILSMTMADGGHFTHGGPGNFTKRHYSVTSYGVTETGHIDYDAVKELARQQKPHLIIVGGSAYPRKIDFQRLADIAHETGAKFMVDASHYMGLIAAGVYDNPFKQGADVVVGSTHKSLRGARGGMILWNDENLRLHEAVFPGMQGEVHPANMMANCQALAEAATPAFREYGQQVLKNAKAMERVFREENIPMVTDGTDIHLVLLDVSKTLGLNGQQASDALERAGLIANKMGIPRDASEPPKGLRVGTPAGTTLGMEEEHFEKVARMVSLVLHGLAQNPENPQLNAGVEAQVREQVEHMTRELNFEGQFAAREGQVTSTWAGNGSRKGKGSWTGSDLLSRSTGSAMDSHLS